MTNKVALEKNVDNILKCIHIADSEEVLIVHELSRMNHPNAPRMNHPNAQIYNT